MRNVLKIAARNLWRYKRRTLLTSILITLGVTSVLLFVSVSGSFKNMMIGQITDSMLGHIQIHRKGYLSSMDSLPLDRNFTEKQVKKIKKMLAGDPDVEAFSPRIRLGAMFSNFTETTNIRLSAVNPEMEMKTVPLLAGRIIKGKKDSLIGRGEILIPELIAKGMKVKIGDSIVLVANNKDGSVNGQTFTVRGVLEGISGPGGRDGVMHIQDARELLRIEKGEASEVAIRLNNMDRIQAVYDRLQQELGTIKNTKGKPVFEIHTWEKLSPFSNIAKMIELMTISMKLIMIAIVLISILNVMIMSVYQRVREIGTMSAIGTAPGRIMGLFLAEGLSLGLIGIAFGNIIGVLGIYILNIHPIRFAFGRMENLLLKPTINASDLFWVSAVVLVVSVFASLQPAYKASKMEPVDALGHV